MINLSQDMAPELVKWLLEANNFSLGDLPLTLKAQTQNLVYDTVLPTGERAILRLKHKPYVPPQRTQYAMLSSLTPSKPNEIQALLAPSDQHSPPALIVGEPVIDGEGSLCVDGSCRVPSPQEQHASASGISAGIPNPDSSFELNFLRTLARETSLIAPRVLQDARGHDLIARGNGWELVLFSYVPGENRTPQALTLKDAARAGAFLAHLHTESRRLMRPVTRDPRLDAEGLLGSSSRYASEEEGTLLTEEDRTLLKRLRARLDEVSAVIGTPQHTLLLHGDYLLQNILFEGDTVGAVDFEMCGWGIDLYDVATFLWQMKPQPHYDKIADAFWQGYTFWRALPPREHLETFIAARHGASVRWLIQNRHLPAYAERVPDLIRQRMGEIAAFLETGVLKRN